MSAGSITRADARGDCADCVASARRVSRVATKAGASPATVSRVLDRSQQVERLEPETVRRYEREHPGELILRSFRRRRHRITRRPTAMVTGTSATVGSSSISTSTMPKSVDFVQGHAG
ncbi:LacI family DNA-binding transcriptional regulator [Mesorhizobium sp. M4A.F.Ca.ET.029.04.2.1]|nr:LacI family DNA-binding transcriptional regulator [Mesorhizobium sp. M4B.F.Ca.ET.088.02.2.1]RVD70721.1 LacI family DNA-binding transcriptional regulator [Mesorhizobium sp. M4A.F.Ca.ET.029.04.2.1]RWF30802.1 MAG: LacI family DNA-binding transcriptional regulator [Mesorhizobium sp.]RWL04028.1 MAG: LacI family DNA-binding transcriptional regulator [Mesorhizobium sp.]